MSLNEVLDVVFRWAHLIAGIMWIGNSMLFNWLDRNLIKPQGEAGLSQGRIYMVHSGAFYEVEKKLLAPGELPDQLHWFRWQNLSTWLTGIALMVVVYYMNGAAFLIDPKVRAMGQGEAIAISVGSLILAWAVYDLIWRALEKQPLVATLLTFGGLLAAAWAFTQVFSGRAAYIQTGVLIGTIMTGNVWMRILPSQRELIRATKEGRAQDAVLSVRAKHRSIHNNYLTFPLLFIMLSNHFHGLYGHHLNWVLLFGAMFGGAGVRHFMNVRYDGRSNAGWLVPAIVVGVMAVAVFMGVSRIKKAPAVTVSHEVGFARVQEIIVQRCASCHSARPTDAQFTAAPNNVMFDTAEQIHNMVPRIIERAVVSETMPFLNRTQMTATERAEIAAWVAAGAKLQ